MINIAKFKVFLKRNCKAMYKYDSFTLKQTFCVFKKSIACQYCDKKTQQKDLNNRALKGHILF